MKRSKLHGGAFVEQRSGDAFVEEGKYKKENWEESKDDEDGRGLFIYGISHFTSTEMLEECFSKYGELSQCYVVKDEQGRRRDFGFVQFTDHSVDDHVLQNNHRIDGSWVSFLISGY